jgi:hypothetical protein
LLGFSMAGGGQADCLGLFQTAQGTRTLRNSLQPNRRQHWLIPPKAGGVWMSRCAFRPDWQSLGRSPNDRLREQCVSVQGEQQRGCHGTYQICRWPIRRLDNTMSLPPHRRNIDDGGNNQVGHSGAKMGNQARREKLVRFYSILNGLEHKIGGVRRLADCLGRMA